MKSSNSSMSSKSSIDFDTVELFRRDDLRGYKPEIWWQRQARKRNAKTLVVILLAMTLAFASIFVLTYKFVHGSNPSFTTTDKVVITFKQHDGRHGDIFIDDGSGKQQGVSFSRMMKILREFWNNHKDDKPTTVRPSKQISSQTIEPSCSAVENEMKFDCNPDEPINEAVCLARGCCWKPLTDTLSLPPLNVPYCYFPDNFVGYEVADIRQDKKQSVVYLRRQNSSGFVDDVYNVKVIVDHGSDHQIRIRIIDALKSRHEVTLPEPLNVDKQSDATEPLYTVNISKEGRLIVLRKSTLIPIFDTDLRRLIYSNQFLQLSSYLPSDYVFGLAEHKAKFAKKAEWSRYTLFNQDQWPIYDSNLYGSHPFYMTVEDKAANSHGVLLVNSNAMDVILQPTPAITWRTIGGILDFFLILGPKPMDVVRQYNNLVGLPTLPPFWGLGFHLCRYGYKSLNNTRVTWKRTRDAGIPFDVQWNDIDYMDRYNDFTYDKNKFAGLPEFVDELHATGMHYVPIFDAAVSAGEEPGSYPPYDDGVKMDIFIKNASGSIFVGKVWNLNNSTWADFTHPKAAAYWTQQFERFHKEIAYDGAWLDMNEPSNFWDGEKNGCPQSSLENPKYLPGGTNQLRHKTVCMTAKQHLGLHYDVHNLFGLYETYATNIALKAVLKRRPFIISRSTFAGHGHYGSHWTGDVASTWDDLKMSIPGILTFNILGIPLVGADICGFSGNTTEELCARWSSLGAFYPFSRNHNTDDAIDQDPVALGSVVTRSAKNALEIRYQLLPLLYTLFYRAHVHGESVARPLFFEFPSDELAHSIESQFMWGSAIMVIPVLEENTTIVNGYFPPGLWYDYVTGRSVIQSVGEYKGLDTPLDSINVVIRGGSILTTLPSKQTTTELRKGNFTLLVAPDLDGKAGGELYWDDGDSLDTILLGKYNNFKFSLQSNTVTMTTLHRGFDVTMPLTRASVLGVKSIVTTVVLNGKTVAFSQDKDGKILNVETNMDMKEFLSLSWS